MTRSAKTAIAPPVMIETTALAVFHPRILLHENLQRDLSAIERKTGSRLMIGQ